MWRQAWIVSPVVNPETGAMLSTSGVLSHKLCTRGDNVRTVSYDMLKQPYRGGFIDLKPEHIGMQCLARRQEIFSYGTSPTYPKARVRVELNIKRT